LEHSDEVSNDEAAEETRFDRDNAEAAAIILADPERYDGALLEWARLWMSRHEREQKCLKLKLHRATSTVSTLHRGAA
jgi:hypothetical protein